MTSKLHLVAAGVAALLAAGAAQAQVQGGPAPGTADSTKVTNENREVREEFNRQVGKHDRKSKRKLTAVPAKPEEIVPGKAVSTLKGELLGTVETVEADGAVISTGKGKVKIAIEGFGRTDQGLVLAISKDEFEAAVVAAHVAKPAG